MEQFGQGLCDATLVPGRSWGDPRARDGSHQPTKRDCARLCASYSACRAWTFNTQVTHLNFRISEYFGVLYCLFAKAAHPS